MHDGISHDMGYPMRIKPYHMMGYPMMLYRPHYGISHDATIQCYQIYHDPVTSVTPIRHSHKSLMSLPSLTPVTSIKYALMSLLSLSHSYHTVSYVSQSHRSRYTSHSVTQSLSNSRHSNYGQGYFDTNHVMKLHHNYDNKNIKDVVDPQSFNKISQD